MHAQWPVALMYTGLSHSRTASTSACTMPLVAGRQPIPIGPPAQSHARAVGRVTTVTVGSDARSRCCNPRRWAPNGDLARNSANEQACNLRDIHKATADVVSRALLPRQWTLGRPPTPATAAGDSTHVCGSLHRPPVPAKRPPMDLSVGTWCSRTILRSGAQYGHRGPQFSEVSADEFRAAFAELGDVGHGFAAVTHARQGTGTFQALFGTALFGFEPDLLVPFCFPLADRAELLFGDKEGHHVFAVVGFSFQPFTVGLGLGVTHLATHIVFGLNLGHGGEPTTGWPIGANSSATFVHLEFLSPQVNRLHRSTLRSPSCVAANHLHAEVRLVVFAASSSR